MNGLKQLEMDGARLNELSEKLETGNLSAEDCKALKALVDTFRELAVQYQQAKTSVKMASGKQASLNNSGTIGLITSLVTDDPVANAFASLGDIGLNLTSGSGAMNALRSSIGARMNPGTVGGHAWEFNNSGTLSSINKALTEEEIANRIVQSSRVKDAIAVAGVGTTTADTLMNLFRQKKCPQQ